MRRILSSIRESLASLGWGNGLLSLAARAADRASGGRCRIYKYVFVAQPVPAAAIAPPPDEARTRIYRATPGDGIIAAFPRPPEVIAQRFGHGAVCLVAERAQALAGFIWIQRQSYREDEVRCDYLLDPAAELAWDFDAYVAPEHRMSRAFAQLWDAANRHLRAEGCRYTISRISAFNAASLAAHRRLGIRRLATGTFVVAGAWQLALFSCKPWIHVGMDATRRPQVVFHPPGARSGAAAASCHD